MKKLIAALCTALLLCGCSSGKPVTAEKETSAAETVSAGSETEDTSSVYVSVIVFSETGNTKAIAQMISEQLDAQLYEIIPETEYTDDDINYHDDSCRANQEQNDPSARPSIANDLSDAVQADVIYLGHPIWWGTNPRIIDTFLDTYDLSGKTVFEFCTSISTGIDRAVSDLKNNHGITVADARRFNASATSDEISEWINEN